MNLVQAVIYIKRHAYSILYALEMTFNLINHTKIYNVDQNKPNTMYRGHEGYRKQSHRAPEDRASVSHIFDSICNLKNHTIKIYNVDQTILIQCLIKLICSSLLKYDITRFKTDPVR